VTVETGVAILFALRRRGFSIRRSPDGNVQVSPFNRLKDADKKMIVANKKNILAALSGEVAEGAQGRGAEGAGTPEGEERPHVLATETDAEWTYVSIIPGTGG